MALTAFFDELDSQFGQIDILVNNAGYAIYDDFENFPASRCRICLTSILLL